MSEAKLLSECGLRYEVEPGYAVAIEPGEYLVIEAGSLAGKPGFRFGHPNVAAQARMVYDFKRYRKDGGKYWTRKAGLSHYFVVPRSAVKLLPEKGYSYVKAEINGVRVSFNVSGVGAGQWTDYLTTRAAISVGHSTRDLRRIAEVAVRGTLLEPLAIPALDADGKADWERLAVPRAKVVEEIAKMVEAGKRPVVKLLEGYTVKEGWCEEVQRRLKRVERDGKRFRDPVGSVRRLSLAVQGYGCPMWAKTNQVDWHATAMANGIAA